MNKAGKRIGQVAVIAVIGIPLAFLLLCPLINDLSAKRVVEELWDLPLPERTERVEMVSRAGKLAGNGNGMQFFGAVLLESSLPFEELDEYYGQFRNNSWSCRVERQEGQAIQITEYPRLDFDTSVTGQNFYILYTWGNGVEPFSYFDLRGH